MHRGYLTPPVLIGLALICIVVAGTLFFNSFLIRNARNPEIPTTSPSPSHKEDCKKLDSQLKGLVDSEEPQTYAKTHGLTWVDGRVRVVVESLAADSTLPESYNLVVESRYEGMIQALALVKDLCPLSDESDVRLVRPPLQAIPGEFCGGIAGISCPPGFECVLDGNYPDAGGKCVKK